MFKVGDFVETKRGIGPFRPSGFERVRSVVKAIQADGKLLVGAADGGNMLTVLAPESVALEGTLPPRRTEIEVEQDDSLSPPLVESSARGPVLAILDGARSRMPRVVADPRVVAFRYRGDARSAIVPALAALGALRVEEELGGVAGDEAVAAMLAKERGVAADRVSREVRDLFVRLGELEAVVLASIAGTRFVLAKNESAGWLAFRAGGGSLGLTRTEKISPPASPQEVLVHYSFSTLLWEACDGSCCFGTSRAGAVHRLLAAVMLYAQRPAALGVGPTMDALTAELGRLEDSCATFVKIAGGHLAIGLGRVPGSESDWLAVEIAVSGGDWLDEPAATPPTAVSEATRSAARRWLEGFRTREEPGGTHPRLGDTSRLASPLREALSAWRWLSTSDSGSAWAYEIDGAEPFIQIAATTDADDQYHETYDVAGNFLVGMFTDDTGLEPTWTDSPAPVRAAAKSLYA